MPLTKANVKMLAPREHADSTIDIIGGTVLSAVVLGIAQWSAMSIYATLPIILAIVAYVLYSVTHPYMEMGTIVSDSVYERKMKIVRNKTHPFASGWYFAGTIDRITRAPKGLFRTEVCRQQLLIYRSHDGEVRAVDPFCPHLGSDIGAGGWVSKEGGLVCPFHEWEFDPSGHVCKVPYDEGCNVDSLGGLKSYHCKEAFGGVFVWYDPIDRPPFYELPTEIKDYPLHNGYKYMGHVEHEMACMVDEIHYNSADPQHFCCLHKDGDMLGSNQWQGYQWNVDPDKRHIAKGTITGILGFGFVKFVSNVEWTNYWLGLILTSSKSVGALSAGNATLLDFTTPIDHHKCRRTVMFFVPWYVPKFLAIIMVRRFFAITMQDVGVWNNKKDIPQPVLVRADTEMMKCNRWLRYLYGKSPATISFEASSQRRIDE